MVLFLQGNNTCPSKQHVMSRDVLHSRQFKLSFIYGRRSTNCNHLFTSQLIPHLYHCPSHFTDLYSNCSKCGLSRSKALRGENVSAQSFWFWLQAARTIAVSIFCIEVTVVARTTCSGNRFQTRVSPKSDRRRSACCVPGRDSSNCNEFRCA